MVSPQSGSKATIKEKILERVQNIQDNPNNSQYSKGLKDGWTDALVWVLQEMDRTPSVEVA